LLDPNSVRHRQKQVEFAFKSGDMAKLIDAYVELADTLLRSDLPDKARAVYKRVAEHDPANERAKAALAMLAPVTTRPPEPPPKAKPTVRDTEGRTAARDAKMKVRDEAAEAGRCGRPTENSEAPRHWACASSTRAPSSWRSRSCGARWTCRPRVATRSVWASCTGWAARSRNRGSGSKPASCMAGCSRWTSDSG